jgi:EpsD family peptidyl-prolyl cis-trans isomerase
VKNKTLTAALLATVLLLPACKREATGQVVAVVNGQEISLSELNGELKGANLPPNATPEQQKAARADALQRLIDRKLLVQQAKERGLDKSPDFLQAQNRAIDDILIGMLGKQVTSNLPVPSTSQIQAFEAKNPGMFTNRVIYSVDQIGFPTPADPSKLQALKDDHSLAAVAKRLDSLGIKYQQRKGQVDSASVPADLLKQIDALPPGEPFVLNAGQGVIVSVVTGKQSQPLDPKQAQAVAADAVRRQSVMETAQKQVKDARAKAKIEYQPGFEPKKPAAGAAKS